MKFKIYLTSTKVFQNLKRYGPDCETRFKYLSLDIESQAQEKWSLWKVNGQLWLYIISKNRKGGI